MSLSQKKHTLIFFGIIFLALFFRVYNLSSVAIHPHLDEVTNGYNAYSLFKTGADEFGKKFPALLQTYNDWRPSLFVYITMPFVAILGLNIFAVRLASVTLSMISLILVYFVTKLLIKDKQQNHKEYFFLVSYVPLAAMLFFAISPWSIYFSRQSHEVNASIMFLFAGMFCFLKCMQEKRNRYLPFSALFFGLSFFAYHGTKIFLLPFCLSLIYIYKDELLKMKKLVLLSIIVFFIVLSPLLLAFMDKRTTVRLTGVSVFNQNPYITDVSANRLLRDSKEKNYLGMFFDNRRFGFIEKVLSNYFSNYNPAWLYVHEDNPAYAIPGVGLFHLFELPLLLFGIYIVIKKPIVKKRTILIIAVWFFAYPFSSAISTEPPHALRTYVGIFPFLFIEAIGAVSLLYFMRLLHNKLFLFVGYVIAIIVVMASLLSFFNNYFVNYKYEYAKKYQYGVQEALSFVKNNEYKYSKIIVSINGGLAQSYMHFLFTTAYDPYVYQNLGGTGDGGFKSVHIIGKYVFEQPISLDKATSNDTKNILYIMDASDMPQAVINGDNKKIQVIKIFYFPDGTPTIYVARKI